MAELSRLPTPQRDLAERCRQITAVMRRDIERTPPEARAPYLLIAEHWDNLAAEAETERS